MRVKGIGKGILSTVIGMTFLLSFSGCQAAKEIVSVEKVAVSKGYSLDQFGLKISADTGLLEQQMKYSDRVKINGNYTEVRAGRSGSGLLALQGFYRTDLLDGEVFINGRTFSQDELADQLVYEDGEIFIYDISHYVFEDSITERLEQNQVTALQAVDCVNDVSEYIVQKNPGKTRQQKPQKIENQQDEQVLTIQAVI